MKKNFLNNYLTVVGIAAVLAIVGAAIFVMVISNNKTPGTEPTETITESTTDSTVDTSEDETSSVFESETEPTETDTEVIPSETEEPSSSELPTDTEEPTVTEEPTPTESEEPTETPTESENPTASEEPEPEKPTYTYEEMNKTMWATSSVNVRDLPSSDGAKLGKLAADDEVTVTGKCNETGWYRITYKGGVGYVSNKYLTSEEPKEEVPSTGTEDTGSEDNGTGDNNTEDEPTEDVPDNREWVSAGVYEVNGYEIRFTETVSRKAYLWAKKLCEAGLYEPVWNEDDNSYYMLITSEEGDSDMAYLKYYNQLCSYIEEKGGTPYGGSGSSSYIYIPGTSRPCYLVSAGVWQ